MAARQAAEDSLGGDRRARYESHMPVVSAASLFETYFAPLYPDDARSDLASARSTDVNPAKNASLFAHVEEAATLFAHMAPKTFGGEALSLDRSDASVHRLSRALTRERRDAWGREGAVGSPSSELFNVVVHGSAYVGACIAQNHGGSWSLRRPLWESVVTLESRAGRADLAIFQWWLKSLADPALENAVGVLTLADRYRAYVEIPCARPEELPVLAEPRVLPRLAKVRYDTLYKHLRAHLPELRDVGEDFPGPERFEAYGFRALEFLLLGGGRMLLLWGTNADGIHLFWLGAAGFEKAAFFPGDAFPAPIVRLEPSFKNASIRPASSPEGEKIIVLTHYEGKALRHELLWWGP
jgi:hypothetical protein